MTDRAHGRVRPTLFAKKEDVSPPHLSLEKRARFDYLCLIQTEITKYVPLGTQKDLEDRHAMALVIPVRALPFV
jgi:hypothetical protein